MATSVRFDGPWQLEEVGGRSTIAGNFSVVGPIVFLPGIRARIEAEGEAWEADSRETLGLAWLPRGTYRFRVVLPASRPPGKVRYALGLVHRESMTDRIVETRDGPIHLASPAGGPSTDGLAFACEALPPAAPIESLPWKRGYGDWFFRHFDHAATTIQSYLLGDSPKLRGRILDVGCGDGITDLGLALRTGCEELVGIDPFRQFERIPQILRDNHLPADLVPARLRFMPESANFLPFEDDSFDVVVSWGSMEHIAGGYLQALREVKRVLRPDGLFFVAPGLYYSNIGHHLDEFSSEPFFHLKMKEEDLKRLVLTTPPKYIDRAGEFATPEQYWQWHKELNRITVSRFEGELRALEFEPWRVALRTSDLIEYTPELQSYPIQDLANVELYMSCVSRKTRRDRA